MPVNAVHREYREYEAQWTRCRDVFNGADAVKAKKMLYLPPLEGHVADGVSGARAYEAYLKRALFYPAMARTVQGLIGLAFTKPPSVLNVPEAFQRHLYDITQTGTTLIGYGINATQEVLITGRAGTLVDMTEEPGVQTQPYWVLYRAEDIINWRIQRIGGKRVLIRVVLREEIEVDHPDDVFVPQFRQQYRVLELVDGIYQVTIYRQDEKDQTKFIPGPTYRPLRRGQPLTFIPFVFHTPTGIEPECAHPPLLDLVDVNLSHFRTSADLEHGAHFTGLPTPYITGHSLAAGEALGIGSGQAWVIPDPQARVGMLEFTGQGLGALERMLESKRLMMATLGARLLETATPRGEAAETVRLRRAGDMSALALLANAMSRGLTQALVWHLYWAGLEEEDANDVEVTLNPDLLERLTADEVRALVAAWQAGTISHQTVYDNLQRGGWTRQGVTFEEELADIEREGAGALPPTEQSSGE
jgi:hypothetical protein